jgi:hypothetical protein
MVSHEDDAFFGKNNIDIVISGIEKEFQDLAFREAMPSKSRRAVNFIMATVIDFGKAASGFGAYEIGHAPIIERRDV